MKNLISLALLLVSIAASAQYKPTAVEGRRWNQYLHPIMTWPGMHYQEFKGDTIYKGKTVKKLISVDANGNYKSLDALVYEDTSAPSLTYYYPQTHGVFGDSVFLNLGLAIGDSSAFICMGDTGYYRYDSVSVYTDFSQTQRNKHHFIAAVNVRGSNRRTFYFSWIEGLGNLLGAGMETILPPMCISDYGYFEVICIFDSSSALLYQNPNYSICDGVGIAETDYPEISLYPNPASTFMEIEGINLKEVNTIQIINSAGIIVKEIKYPEKGRIDLKGLPNGIYSLNVIFQNNTIASKKMVKVL